jgi:two-component system alkaline phosphatase synthesis response regulator PhoP
MSTPTTPTLLVVDDEQTIRDVLEYNLRREGYHVLTAADGDTAIRLAMSERPDLVILDIMLPGVSGLDVLRTIRREMTVPVLMLSARETEIDKVLGLELGADDYMTKPFSLRELLARVRAMLRRTEMLHSQAISGPGAATPVEAGLLERGHLLINLSARTVVSEGQSVELKPKEFDLLAFLAAHPGQVFSREVLLDRVWGYDYVGGTRTVDVHISWLRSKLERDPSSPQILQTVHGVGYRFSPPAKE